MRRLAGLFALALLPAPALADVVSTGPDKAAVVIYRDPEGAQATERVGQGVAMVIETRTLDLPAGRSIVRFQGVADTMVPQTVGLEGLPGSIAERNFDYELLSPGALVAKAVGQTVRLVRTHPRTGRTVEETGVIRSAPDGVLIETATGVEALQCSGLPEKLVFDRAPPGLSDHPTLSMQADVPKAGRYAVTLSYLATRFNWSADYVAYIRSGGRTLDLSGWLTLANQSGTSFPAAPTYVVAGRLERSEDTEAVEVEAESLSAHCWPTATWAQMMRFRSAMAKNMPAPPPAPMAMRGELQEVVVTASRVAAVSDLGDLKLYTLPELTAVSARQVKQVAFLQKGGAPFERVYLFRGEDMENPEELAEGRLVLRMQNEQARGLGVALPAGRVSVMQAGPGGAPLFVGERTIRDTAVGLPVELSLNESRAVTGEGKAEVTDLGAVERTTRTLTFRNTSALPAVVEVREGQGSGSLRLVSEGRRHANRGDDLVWTLPLAPGASGALRYTFEVRND